MTALHTVEKAGVRHTRSRISLLLLFLYPATGLFSWYFSRTNSEPLPSSFKFHTAVLSVLSSVPSAAAFCSESIECFPGMASKFFFRLFVTIPVAPVITSIIIHFIFHIRCTSIHKLLCFSFFSASLYVIFLSAGTHVLVYYYYYYYYY